MPHIVTLEVTKRNFTLLEMAREKRFTDTTFHCSNGELVYAHQLILMSSSIYFQDLEKDNMELHDLTIFIPGFSRHCVDFLMELFYVGSVVIKDENLNEFNNLLIFFRVKEMNE
jgi:hypothetical protein